MKSNKSEAKRRKAQSNQDKLANKMKKLAVTKVRGRGGYIADAGGFLGSKAGGFLGRLAGGAVERITGMGDYVSNSLFKGSEKSLQGMALREFAITNYEYVLSIVSPPTPSAFNITRLNLNPGLPVFPWMSVVASRFNRYEVEQMVFCVESTSSEYAVGAGLGVVALAHNPDVMDRTFTSIQEVEGIHGAVSAKPSQNMLLGVECDPRLAGPKSRYVRTGAVPTGADPHLYDWGSLYVATEGLSAPAGTVIGRLKVMYTVRLQNPLSLGLAPYTYIPLSTAVFRTGTVAATAITNHYWGTVSGTHLDTLAVTPLGATQVMPSVVSGLGGSSNPMVGVNGNVLSLYGPGLFYITLTVRMAGAPGLGNVVPAVANGTANIGDYPAANTAVSNGLSVGVHRLYVTSTGTATNPCTITLNPFGNWAGATCTSSEAWVAYMGQA